MPHAKKLTEIEQCYFDNNWDTLSLPTLMEKLDRTENFLQKLIISKLKEAPKPAEVQERPPAEQEVNKPPPALSFNKLVGRQKNSDGTVKKNAPVVMTEAAAMVADEHLKTGNAGGMSPRLAQSVFRMRED